MNFSIGLLHSSLRFLELLLKHPFDKAYIKSGDEMFFISPIIDIINLSHKCNWIELDNQGYFILSTKGKDLLFLSNYENRLRKQIKDIIIAYQPTWCKSIIYGRQEFFRYVPRDISQCFKDSGLFQSDPSDEIVNYWDELAGISRGFRNSELLRSGRLGERYTLKYEFERTGKKPKWQALESNFSGYDILSILSDSDLTPLRIEVKTSIQRLKEAKLHITINEWNNAQSTDAYLFYLWIINSEIKIACLSSNDIISHIPSNNGSGQWESVEIPMLIFKERFHFVKFN